MPNDREITPKDALLLAALYQWLQLVEHRSVTPVKLLGREPTHVEREQAVEHPSALAHADSPEG